jgi:transcriptional regulator with XRE-family HTH domain
VRNPKTPLGAWIVEQRKARDWKSEELARQLGVADSTVRSWEARRTAEEERGVIAEILARLEARLELGTEPASNGAGDAGSALRHA